MKTLEPKKTESQEAIELFQMELEEKTKPEEKAEFIIKSLSAIKRAYSMRLNELGQEILAIIAKPSKDATVDELIILNDERKLREYQMEVRHHSIDQLERQIKMGKVNDWIQSTIDIYENMHSVVCGSTLAK